MLGGPHRSIRILLKLSPTYLLKVPDDVIKMLVSVLGAWQLHNTGNLERLPAPVPKCLSEVALQLAHELYRGVLGLVGLITVFSVEEIAKIITYQPQPVLCRCSHLTRPSN
jgi:hypothetical protein